MPPSLPQYSFLVACLVMKPGKQNKKKWQGLRHVEGLSVWPWPMDGLSRELFVRYQVAQAVSNLGSRSTAIISMALRRNHC
jgi:hypothetical protein